jgi:alpha-amylase/alpha-mannosidase (GH57 family)
LINICIHGHFYQPPRENPWTGEIELQPSAAPYHDWNEKIYDECYKPNTEADIIDDTGKLVLEVNNYEYINFNFGPTLLAWIKNKHPETYKSIIDADKKSIKTHKGHGNAIAMCYNHMIMPLGAWLILNTTSGGILKASGCRRLHVTGKRLKFSLTKTSNTLYLIQARRIRFEK